MANFVQLRSGVVIPEASFAEGIGRRPTMDEIATSRDGRDITIGYVDSLPLLSPRDSILQARGAGDYAIYDEVARDDQVKTCLQQRWDAVVSKETIIEPADSSRKAKKAASVLTEAIGRIQWDDINRKMLSGEFWGYGVAECMWATDGATITLDTIKVRNPRRFGFRPDGELRIKTMAKPVEGEPLPPAKFWAYTTGAWHDDDPYGLGLCHWLYWPVFFKRNDLRFCLIFLEKFGQGTVVGLFPQGTHQSEQTKLLQAAQAIQTDSAVAIPDTMKLSILEAQRSGTADYMALYDRMNAAISKVCLGHTGSTDATPGRLGGETNAASVREDLIKASADLICMSFTRQVATWLTRWNDETAPVPRVWRRVESDPDLKSQAERDKLIVDIGYRPTLKYVTETYGVEAEPVQSASVTPPVVDPAADPNQPDSLPAGAQAAFADVPRFTPEQQAIEDIADAALENPVQPLADEAIRNAIAGAKSPEDLDSRLAVLLADVSRSEFTTQFERGLFSTDIMGYVHAEVK